MNISVILPAAGLGRRFAVGEGAGVRASGSKIEFELSSKPVFLRTIELFNERLDVEQIILAVDPDKLDDFKFRWGDQLGFLGVKLIAGGKTERWETVQIALEQVDERATHVAVHDAARPCASQAVIERVFAAAQQYGAAVPGLAMGDTVKRVGSRVESLGSSEKAEGDPLAGIFDDGAAALPGAGPIGEIHQISETVDRAGLYRVQTPQVFEKGLLVETYAGLTAENAAGITDDASVVERAGGEVFIVEGDAMNLKLTHPADVELMEAVLKMRQEKAAKDMATKQLFGDDDDD